MFASTSACISLRTSSNASMKSAAPAAPPSRVTRLMYPAMNGLSAMSWSNACRLARAATGGGWSSPTPLTTSRILATTACCTASASSSLDLKWCITAPADMPASSATIRMEVAWVPCSA